jgi:hypothetical protein
VHKGSAAHRSGVRRSLVISALLPRPSKGWLRRSCVSPACLRGKSTNAHVIQRGIAAYSARHHLCAARKRFVRMRLCFRAWSLVPSWVAAFHASTLYKMSRIIRLLLYNQRYAANGRYASSVRTLRACAGPECVWELLAPGHVREGLRITRESFGCPPRVSAFVSSAPRAGPARIEVGTPGSVRARVASRVVSCRAPHNETLQLPGADLKEVVVAAALARTMRPRHLPGQ